MEFFMGAASMLIGVIFGAIISTKSDKISSDKED